LNLGEQGKSLGDLGEADPANRISPVKFVSSYEVLETCVRRVNLESVYSVNKVSDNDKEARGSFTLGKRYKEDLLT
jgi:hypothetical protein